MKTTKIILPLLCSIVFGLSACAQSTISLTRHHSEYLAQLIAREWFDANASAYKVMLDRQYVEVGGNQMRFMYKTFGEAPADGRSLWISLHGGGGVPSEENDQQWENQIRLYEPSEGIYVAPRAPWNAWDMWCQAPIDVLYEKLIETCVAMLGVNPDKVYLLGYSAGGDGVWRMAPRMADHWAAASMMAGHPGDVSLVNLRNMPFMIWCGAQDYAYNRNAECAKRGMEMKELHEADPEGYIHETHIVANKGHWMDLIDRAAVPWMERFKRNPYPSTIVWQQEAVLRPMFYWLAAPANELARGKRAVVHVNGNVISIDECDYSTLTLYLNDQIVNLDKPVQVNYKGRQILRALLPRTEENLRRSFAERHDCSFVFPARLELKMPK